MDVVETWDAVVVGGGIGGLAAAIELGATPHVGGRPRRVLVLEAHPELGGKAGRVHIDGIDADTGPSLLTMPEVFDGLLRRAGTTLTDELELISHRPWFHYRWADGARLNVAPNLETTLDEVRREFGARAARELSDYLAHAASIWDAAAPTFVFGPPPSLGVVARMGPRALRLLARVEPLRTLSASVRAHVREPHLAMLLERYATFNGSDPRRAPATLGCIAHLDLARGARGVRGGVSALVQALARAARRVGVELRTNANVTKIVCTEGAVAGVELEDGRRVRTRCVIANADPAHVFGALLTVTGVAKLRLRGSGPPSMSGWTAILRARRAGTAGAPRDRAAHTVLFPRDYRQEFRDIFDRARPPDEPTVYLCAQERAHQSVGWHEHEPLFAMVNAPPEPALGSSDAWTWHTLRERVLARLVGAGLIAADDECVWERSPRGLADRFPGSRGAIYGTASNSLTAAFLRVPNEIRGVPGLFLASGGAHPGGGMPLAALSGIQAARAARASIAWQE